MPPIGKGKLKEGVPSVDVPVGVPEDSVLVKLPEPVCDPETTVGSDELELLSVPVVEYPVPDSLLPEGVESELVSGVDVEIPVGVVLPESCVANPVVRGMLDTAVSVVLPESCVVNPVVRGMLDPGVSVAESGMESEAEGIEMIVEPSDVRGIIGIVVPELAGMDVTLDTGIDAAPVVPVPPPFNAVETAELRADDAAES